MAVPICALQGATTGGRHSSIKFIGVWDTVASVIVPRLNGLIPFLLTLPCTATNSSIEVFRQATAIDERRSMFQLNRWTEPQPFAADKARKAEGHG